jgi:energy-coupling factor transporter ATP-binding protein EcfA2
MRITKISILNFLGLSSLKMDSLAKVTRISGGNGVGKSTILKAIETAIKSSGKSPHLIKLDTDKAEIMVEIDDSIVVNRTLTPTGNTVRVTVNDQPVSAPQTFLNNLFGPFNFNPVDFFLAKGPERRELILQATPFRLTRAQIAEMLGPEFSEIDDSIPALDESKHGLEVLEQFHALVYDRRTEQGRDVTRLKKALEQDKLDIPAHLNAEKFAAFNLADATQKLTEAKAHNRSLDGKTAQLNSLRSEAQRLVAEIDHTEQELVRKKALLVEIREKGTALKAEVESFQLKPFADLEKAITEYQSNQRLMMKVEDIERRKKDIEREEAVHELLDVIVKRLSTDVPRQVLAQINLPIDGLEVKGDALFVNGVSVDTLSTSEQVRLAVVIGRSLSGELKVICIDRFESLDDDAKKAFIAETAKDEFEYLMTCVTSGPLHVEGVAVPAAAPAKAKAGKQVNSGTEARVGF